MRASVDWLQGQIAGIVDQDEVTTNISSTDYSLRLNYLNRSLEEWAEVGDWQTLYREYNCLVSTSTGNASIALPTNFRRLASFPKITSDGSNTYEFPEVLPQEDGRFSNTDKRVWVMGSPNSGYVLRVHGATLVSGASVKVPIYVSPTSLASTTDIADIPNPQFLIQRTVAYLWEGREDPRFPQAKADADRILANMLERENTPNMASEWDTVKTVEERKYNFRIGRD